MVLFKQTDDQKMTEEIYQINPTVKIPKSEISFSFSRSGGKGGQHVNKVETKVELWFDLLQSPSLSDYQKNRILSKLGFRVDSNGIMKITSQKHRSQMKNRDDAVAKFISLIELALEPEKLRFKTKPSKASKEKRITEKKKISVKKVTRRTTYE